MTSWLQITSGRGPAECAWVVAKVLSHLVEDANKLGLKVDLLQSVPGQEPGTMKSVLLALDGEHISNLVHEWEGTIQWIGQSPFRPNHKRKNWYIGVSSLSLPETFPWSEKDLMFEAMRGSGPGGQHVNTTDTAVRLTHVPTGLRAEAREERSQHLNRKLALGRLAEKLKQKAERLEQRKRAERWRKHDSLERGSPIRVYSGIDFVLRTSSHGM